MKTLMTESKTIEKTGGNLHNFTVPAQIKAATYEQTQI